MPTLTAFVRTARPFVPALAHHAVEDPDEPRPPLLGRRAVSSPGIGLPYSTQATSPRPSRIRAVRPSVRYGRPSAPRRSGAGARRLGRTPGTRAAADRGGPG